MIKDQMEKIYSTMSPEEIPWNEEIPPDILKHLVETEKITPCKVIELGCGAGNYLIYLSTKGCDTTGIDISESTIDIARRSAAKKGTKYNFI